MTFAYGYNDEDLVPNQRPIWDAKRYISLVFALLFVTAVWYGLNQKLVHGEDWLSETYDNPDWKTNEGTMATHGAWDLETHIWKTVYIMEHFPNFQWNPYWYLGVPLLKYYQLGFYALHAAVIILTGVTAPRAALLMIIYAHLLATYLTFLLCYRLSRKIWTSALCSTFILSNTFISLRSYGWEPITVVFLFIFPLGLLLYLRKPLEPFRLSLILVLGLAYLAHPLIWFTLCMFIGLYLLSLSIRNRHRLKSSEKPLYMWKYVALVFLSIFVGFIQFYPQLSYEQASSGAHMGVTYLPYYQVPPNIIPLHEFLFDAGNLKGPGPIVMIAFFLIIIFGIIEYRARKKKTGLMLTRHELIAGLTFILFMMVLFYYLELYDIFPMNLLRSIQYHRIIPEFIITAAALVATLSNIARTYRHKVIYYSMLICFVAASGIILYGVQERWATTDDIYDRPEFIWEEVEGRISNPYPDQSLTVRNSFTNRPQVYGYYEQGITNAYNDELMSVSSGFQNADHTILYLQAANVKRLYINNQDSVRDNVTRERLLGQVKFVESDNRYSYFEIPIANPSFAQAISASMADEVITEEPGCRIIFKEEYCGSAKEEFIATDHAELTFLTTYVDVLARPYVAGASYEMMHPDYYRINVTNAEADTVVVVKMTWDKDFVAYLDGEEIPVEKFGPDFMLLRPQKAGSYSIDLKFKFPSEIIIGAAVTAITVSGLLVGFTIHAFRKKKRRTAKKDIRGDM